MTSQSLNRACGVDVLSVLDEARAAVSEGQYPGTSLELDKARAAVAELIEAAKLALSPRHEHSAINSPDDGETCGVCGRNFRNGIHYRAAESEATDKERLRAALAAVEGHA